MESHSGTQVYQFNTDQFICGVCQCTFTDVVSLLAHKIEHSIGIERELYKCELCKELFLRTELLQQHYHETHKITLWFKNPVQKQRLGSNVEELSLCSTNKLREDVAFNAFSSAHCDKLKCSIQSDSENVADSSAKNYQKQLEEPDTEAVGNGNMKVINVQIISDQVPPVKHNNHEIVQFIEVQYAEDNNLSDDQPVEKRNDSHIATVNSRSNDIGNIKSSVDVPNAHSFQKISPHSTDDNKFDEFPLILVTEYDKEVTAINMSSISYEDMENFTHYLICAFCASTQKDSTALKDHMTEKHRDIKFTDFNNFDVHKLVNQSGCLKDSTKSNYIKRIMTFREFNGLGKKNFAKRKVGTNDACDVALKRKRVQSDITVEGETSDLQNEVPVSLKSTTEQHLTTLHNSKPGMLTSKHVVEPHFIISGHTSDSIIVTEQISKHSSNASKGLNLITTEHGENTNATATHNSTKSQVVTPKQSAENLYNTSQHIIEEHISQPEAVTSESTTQQYVTISENIIQPEVVTSCQTKSLLITSEHLTKPCDTTKEHTTQPYFVNSGQVTEPQLVLSENFTEKDDVSQQHTEMQISEINASESLDPNVDSNFFHVEYYQLSIPESNSSSDVVKPTVLSDSKTNFSFLFVTESSSNMDNLYLKTRFVCLYCNKQMCSREPFIKHVLTFHKDVATSDQVDSKYYDEALQNEILRKSGLQNNKSSDVKFTKSVMTLQEYDQLLPVVNSTPVTNKEKTMKIEENKGKMGDNVEDCDTTQKTSNLRRLEKQDLQGSFPCGICGKVFARLRYLRRHVKNHQEENKLERHTCTECGKQYQKIDSLKIHKRKHHNVDVKFKCKTCEFTSNDKKDIFHHRQIHPEGSIVCHICGNAYADRSTLARHLNVHDMTRPHVCKWDGCTWRFKSDIMMNAHYQTHLNTPGKFVCKYCGKAFRRKHHLQRHQVKMHGTVAPKPKAYGLEYENEDLIEIPSDQLEINEAIFIDQPIFVTLGTQEEPIVYETSTNSNMNTLMQSNFIEIVPSDNQSK